MTYEAFAEAWPSRSGDFADKFNSMPKYVVSTTLTEPSWSNSTLIGGNVADEVPKLKRQHGGDILVNGSARLVHALIEHGLVDEYRLMVSPVVLGSGKRLFGDTRQTAALRLDEARPVGPDGVVILTYRPASKAS